MDTQDVDPFSLFRTLGELAEKSLPKAQTEKQAPSPKKAETAQKTKPSSSIRFGSQASRFETKNASYRPALNDPSVIDALLNLSVEADPDSRSKPQGRPESSEFESASPSSVDAKVKERIASSFKVRAASTKILR